MPQLTTQAQNAIKTFIWKNNNPLYILLQDLFRSLCIRAGKETSIKRLLLSIEQYFFLLVESRAQHTWVMCVLFMALNVSTRVLPLRPRILFHLLSPLKSEYNSTPFPIYRFVSFQHFFLFHMEKESSFIWWVNGKLIDHVFSEKNSHERLLLLD